MRLRCYHGQTIAEILTDSVTKMMMEADGIDARELETALSSWLEARLQFQVASYGRGSRGGDNT